MSQTLFKRPLMDSSAPEMIRRFHLAQEQEVRAKETLKSWPEDARTPVKSSLRKVARNDPCLCGSGAKYKKCCRP